MVILSNCTNSSYCINSAWISHQSSLIRIFFQRTFPFHHVSPPCTWRPMCPSSPVAWYIFSLSKFGFLLPAASNLHLFVPFIQVVMMGYFASHLTLVVLFSFSFRYSFHSSFVFACRSGCGSYSRYGGNSF